MEFLIKVIGHVALFFISVFLGWCIGIMLFMPQAKADVNGDVVTIIKESARNGLDPLLVAAVIKVESGWNKLAVGSSGERGLMQMHPKFHSNQSIKAGIEYLAKLKQRLGPAFITAYNNGPSRRPKYPHLNSYHIKVMREYEALKETSRKFN